jgi:hypothetical protein
MAGMRIAVRPASLDSGDAVDVVVEGIPAEFAGRAGELIVVGVDRIETHWIANIGGTVSTDGRFEGQWQPSVIDESVLEVNELRIAPSAGDAARSWDLSGMAGGRCIVGGERGEWSPEKLAARANELRQEQEALYAGPIGDPTAPGSCEHRALCIVERLRSTRSLRLPAASLLPLSVGNPGSGEPPLIDAILEHLGWPSRIETKWWADHSAAGRPWTGILVGPVFATDQDAAAQLAWEARDRITDILSLTRGSSPRPLVTVVEQRQEPNGVKWRIYQEDERYRGNLIGGFIAGEDQRELLYGNAALSSDPLLALTVRLFREAQAERDIDAAYFRYWSLLEALSGARFAPPHSAVTLLDGSAWPGSHNTTANAVPRVYALLAGHLSGVDEKSSVAPAGNLYEAVRAWYARRNATGHYGRFDPTDSVQQSQSWFRWAAKTSGGGGGSPLGDSWLWSLQQIASLVLRRELADVGRSAL